MNANLHAPSSSKPPVKPSPPRRSILLAVCLLLIAAACVFLSWRQATRPGTTHYLKGMEYASAQKFDQAQQEWLLGVREDPGSAECYEQLGLLYTEVRRYADAEECYKKATANAPDRGALFLALARVQQIRGDLKAAAANAERAAQLLPDNPEAVGEYGMLAARQKRRPVALRALRKAHDLRPGDTRYLLAMVNLEMDAMDMAQAERDLAPYMQAHSDDAQAAYMMAVIYNQKPRTPENVRIALDYARRSRPGMRPSDPRAYVLIGQLLLASNKPTEALQAYSLGAKIAPQAEDVLHGLLDCYNRLGQTRQADAVAVRLQAATARHDRIGHLKHVMGFNHFDTTSGLELARLEEEDGRRQTALGYYMQLVRQSPKDPRTRAALVAFLRRSGRPDMAQKAARPDFIP